jgi:hypothetical protein
MLRVNKCSGWADWRYFPATSGKRNVAEAGLACFRISALTVPLRSPLGVPAFNLYVCNRPRANTGESFGKRFIRGPVIVVNVGNLAREVWYNAKNFRHGRAIDRID